MIVLFGLRWGSSVFGGMDVDVAVFHSWDLELEAAGSMEPQLFGVDFGPVESEENDAF